MATDRYPPAELLLAAAFPYHLLIDLTSGRIVARGDIVARWLGRELVGERFEDCFTLIRPKVDGITAEALAGRTRDVFMLDYDRDHKLRGQMIVHGDHAVFVGSPAITMATSIEAVGLKMTDFAPHDATPEIMVLAQFAEMKVRDLERRSDQLRQAIEDGERLSERASTDPLTGLANRRAFWEQCTAVLGGAGGGGSADRERSDDSQATGPILLYLDVDGFKGINDEHGHQVGDEVLRVIADRLAGSVRTGDLVARVGGDEFAVLLRRVKLPAQDEVVERIRQTVVAEVSTEDGLIPISVSIGATTVQAGQTVDELIRDSDTAMYRGRAEHRGRITWFADRMRVEREERRMLTTDLLHTIRTGGIGTVYQPIVRLGDGSIVGFEALARWSHPERGPVTPAVFVELAERAGAIGELDRRVMETGLKQLASWRRTRSDLTLQVNASGRSIGPDLIERVVRFLGRARIPAHALSIEVTESWFIEGDEVAAVLRDLTELGIQLHLDDFGTGYSSLTHLHEFPISGVKIDRSFVAQIVDSERSRRLVAATISMARSLGLDVIAEGIETAAQAQLLAELGCTLAQGFLYSPPVDAAAATELLSGRLAPCSLEPVN